MTSRSLLLGVVGAMVAASIFVLTIGGLDRGLFAMPGDGGIGWRSVALGYVITVVGVILGSAYRDLQRKREKGETTVSLAWGRDLFMSIELWKGLFASPIVYALLIRSLGDIEIPALCITALQNGFVCTLVADELPGRGKVSGRRKRR